VCLNIHICVRLGACDTWRWWYAARWNRLDVIQLSGRSSSVSPNRSSLHFHSTAAVFTSPLAQNASAHTHAHTNTPAFFHTSLLTNWLLRNESLFKKKKRHLFWASLNLLLSNYISRAFHGLAVRSTHGQCVFESSACCRFPLFWHCDWCLPAGTMIGWFLGCSRKCNYQ